MSKPDAYMPFVGNAFFQAVEGQSDRLALGYLRAIWHYWQHLHCEGLPDDDEYLRRLCRFEEGAEWFRAKAVLFDGDKFFALGEDGRWHQKAAAVMWAEINERYQRQVRAGQHSARVRWGKRKK